MNTKLDHNMNAMNTKIDTSMNEVNTKFGCLAKIESMITMMMSSAGDNDTPTILNTDEQVSQQASPALNHISNIINYPQLTIAAVTSEENNKVSVPPVPPATHFPIITNNEITPKKNDVPTNIITPTNADNESTTTTIEDPPNIK